jgi:RHH-type transcriptional regulator, proline utilization regulon repressor / proline dehydrogenase / delta 1-pyrroline-5-carboxylate dehydrogenase
MPERRNSLGAHLANGSVLREMAERMGRVSRRAWVAAPLVAGKEQSGPNEPIRNPADSFDAVGSVASATSAHVRAAIDIAHEAQPAWDATAPAVRAEALEKAAVLF